MKPIHEHRVTAVPQSMIAYHQLTELGQAARVIPSPTKIMVRHDVAGTGEVWAILKGAETLWMVYDKAPEDIDNET